MQFRRILCVVSTDKDVRDCQNWYLSKPITHSFAAITENTSVAHHQKSENAQSQREITSVSRPFHFRTILLVVSTDKDLKDCQIEHLLIPIKHSYASRHRRRDCAESPNWRKREKSKKNYICENCYPTPFPISYNSMRSEHG